MPTIFSLPCRRHLLLEALEALADSPIEVVKSRETQAKADEMVFFQIDAPGRCAAGGVISCYS
jgi:hypothetical protein